jgi:hypothetical protein
MECKLSHCLSQIIFGQIKATSSHPSLSLKDRTKRVLSVYITLYIPNLISSCRRVYNLHCTLHRDIKLFNIIIFWDATQVVW